ncbi:MAG: AraC family transcriptional regulator [Bacteroidota bacterium]
MQPVLEKIHQIPTYSFSLKEDIIPYISIPWHYHPEYEITLLTEGSGKRFVGDHVEEFNDSELIMLGKNLPHCWRNDAAYFKKKEALRTRAIVIHFKEDAWGNSFFQQPEMIHIQTLLALSGRGIRFTGGTLQEGILLMERMLKVSGFERVLLLFQLLSTLSKSHEKYTLASLGYRNRRNENKMEQIEQVYQYALTNYLDEISIDYLATKLNLSISAFCRFFKKHTGKNFTRFINEMRIGYACRLLIETDFPVQRICFECGFNNPSYFFRSFQKITGQSPLLYRREFKHS